MMKVKMHRHSFIWESHHRLALFKYFHEPWELLQWLVCPQCCHQKDGVRDRQEKFTPKCFYENLFNCINCSLDSLILLPFFNSLVVFSNVCVMRGILIIEEQMELFHFEWFWGSWNAIVESVCLINYSKATWLLSATEWFFSFSFWAFKYMQ